MRTSIIVLQVTVQMYNNVGWATEARPGPARPDTAGRIKDKVVAAQRYINGFKKKKWWRPSFGILVYDSRVLTYSPTKASHGHGDAGNSSQVFHLCKRPTISGALSHSRSLDAINELLALNATTRL
jgi:hypothetical protein